MNHRLFTLSGFVFLIFLAACSGPPGGANGEDFQTEVASMGSLTATVGATGIVRARQSAVLAFETTGTVEDVYAAVGDAVDSGELLVTLEQTSLPSTVSLAQIDLVEAERALDNLLNSEVAQAQARLNLAQARDAFSDAEYRWRVNQKGFRANGETIAAAEANLILAEKEVERAEQAYNRLSSKPPDNPSRALARSNLSAAREARDSQLRRLNWYTGEPTEEDQALLDGELALSSAQLVDAEREWARVQNGADPDDILAGEARVAAARATLEMAQIAAPFTGMITRASLLPGDQVAPGTFAMSLDDFSELYVDVQISEVDINRIEVGQPVRLTFDAVLDQEYVGEVVDVGLAGEVTQGVVNFEITVLLTDVDENVRPGMTAAVNLVVNELEDALLIPNRAVRIQNGERVVYTLEDGQLVPLRVQLGASSESYSELLEGEVEPGDVIVLNPPTVFDEDGPPPFVGR